MNSMTIWLIKGQMNEQLEKRHKDAMVLQEKIGLLDYLLNSLCSKELNMDGRDFIVKLKDKFIKMYNNELEYIKIESGDNNRN